MKDFNDFSKNQNTIHRKGSKKGKNERYKDGIFSVTSARNLK